MNAIKALLLSVIAVLFITPYCIGMDKKRATESPVKKTLDQKLVEAAQSNKLSSSKKFAAISRLLTKGAGVNTKIGQTPIIFKIAQDKVETESESEIENQTANMRLIKLFLKHPKFDAYATDFYFNRYRRDDYDSMGSDVTLLEWAGYEDKYDLLKILIYLGHESHIRLKPEGFDNPGIKRLIAAPHEYQFSEKEKSEYEEIMLAIGINNGAKLKQVFIDLKLITHHNAAFAELSSLIGQYVCLGLMTPKIRRMRCDRITEICVIV